MLLLLLLLLPPARFTLSPLKLMLLLEVVVEALLLLPPLALLPLVGRLDVVAAATANDAATERGSILLPPLPRRLCRASGGASLARGSGPRAVRGRLVVQGCRRQRMLLLLLLPAATMGAPRGGVAGVRERGVCV